MTTADVSIVARTRTALMALGAQRGPIIVGPWLSEVGFELLYWIPFLRWACAFAHLQPEDLWIVSRGGPRSWYADLSPNYIDVLDFYSPEQFKAGNMQRMTEQATHGRMAGRMSTKQHQVTSFDRAILKQVSAKTGVPTTRMIHPSMMYDLFRPFWTRQLPDLYRQSTTVERLTTTTAVPGLPASYVAAKFYVSAACPGKPILRRLVNEIVRTQARTSDVVLLHSGTEYDDHGEFQIDRHPRIRRIALDPATNLETQTAVLAGAKSFIGTYGGFAYLAPFLGIPSKTYFGFPNFRRDHRDVISELCVRPLRTAFRLEQIGRRREAYRAA